MSSEHGNAPLARRDFIAADAASFGWLAAGDAAVAAAAKSSAPPAQSDPHSAANALVCDVVDGRGAIIREEEPLAQRKSIRGDWSHGQ